MAGLIDQAGNASRGAAESLARARGAWEASMHQTLERLRSGLQDRDPVRIAELSGGSIQGCQIRIEVWGHPVVVGFPSLEAWDAESGKSLSTFDLGMLLYYLDKADGEPLAGRWISYRDLPGGLFYHQAFQGYSGDRIAHELGDPPEAFRYAAGAMGGTPLPTMAPLAYGFDPLPRVLLAVVLWPGDDEFAARASVLFDAAAPHFLPTDGLALLGAGLTGRLLKAAPPNPV